MCMSALDSREIRKSHVSISNPEVLSPAITTRWVGLTFSLAPLVNSQLVCLLLSRIFHRVTFELNLLLLVI